MTNLLEHVTDARQLATNVQGVLSRGSWLVVSVPNSYPYHPDPIDTMFRPTVAELTEMQASPLLWGEGEGLICESCFNRFRTPSSTSRVRVCTEQVSENSRGAS